MQNTVTKAQPVTNNASNPHVRSPAYADNPGMSSVISYPERSPLWGDGKYRGNCDGRLFKDLVLRYRPKRVADPMMGSGTTRDVTAGLNQNRRLNIHYCGGDLRTGFNLLRRDFRGTYDFIWIHPPYWNIIRYSDEPDDLSTIDDYPEFLGKLRICLAKCYRALAPGGRLAVLVADIRRTGQYTPLGRDVMNMEGDLGKLVSVIIKAQHNCRSDAIPYRHMAEVPIKHEYCIVFRKMVQR